jgi:hypothetical protein
VEIEKEGVDFLHVILSEYGLAMALSLIFNVVAYRLYKSEKQDRKDAWVAHNALVKATNEIMGKTNEVLVRIQERIK